MRLTNKWLPGRKNILSRKDKGKQSSLIIVDVAAITQYLQMPEDYLL